LKIVFVSHAFPPYTGGLSYVVENISVNLVKKGFEVEVVTLDIDKNLPRYEDYKGVQVKRFKGYAPDGCYYIPSIEFIKYLKNLETDILHVHNIGSVLTPMTIYIMRRIRRRPKIVVTPHHHESGSKWHTRIAWLIYKPLARHYLHKADILHAVSEYEASLIKRDFKLEAIVIPNGVSEDVFYYKWDPPKDEIVLTYAGRVEKYKRADLVLKIASELTKFGLDIRVKVIGEGSDLLRIRRIAREMKIKLETPGFLPREKYLKELSKSTALINLSDYEAYSIVTAEALAIGVPVVIAEPWGMTFKNIVGAYIVDKRDIRKIIDIIVKIYNNVSSYKDHVHQNSNNEKILSWSDVVERIIQKLYY
jgi:glycosyltransferase involved in cell wall biosynthesis